MEQSKIPSTKVERAMRFVKTGAQIGGNYIKHYSGSFQIDGRFGGHGAAGY